MSGSSDGGSRIGGRSTVSEPAVYVAEALEDVAKRKKPKRRVNIVGSIKNIGIGGAQVVTKIRNSTSLYGLAGSSDLEPLEPEQQQMTTSLVVIGDSMAGKTTLLTRFIQHNFFSDYLETLAPQFYAKNIECVDSSSTRYARIRVQLWDTPGSVLMRATLPVWIRAARVVLFTFSLAEADGATSFAVVKELFSMVSHCVDDAIAPLLFLVGTKADETPSQGRFKPLDDLQSFARKNNAQYYEVSARTGAGIDELFAAIGKAVLDASVAKEARSVPGWISDASTPVCLLCRSLFTLTNRRHHCRNCGGLFCGRCSSKFIALPKIGKLLPTRVCLTCYDLQTASSSGSTET